MATILRLPVEVATLISEHLWGDDFFNFRQTCKSLNIKTLSAFARRYCTTGSVMMEQHSLEGLLRISQSPVLGPSIQELEIFLHHLLPIDEFQEVNDPNSVHYVRGFGEELEMSGDETEQVCHRNPYKAGPSMHVPQRVSQKRNQPKVNKAAYLECLADQNELLRTGRGIATLTKAMQGLTNCQEISIVYHQPCGSERLREKIGFLPETWVTMNSPSSVQFVRHVLHAVSVAVAESQIPTHKLRICEGGFTQLGRISPEMLVKSTCSMANEVKVPSITSLSLFVHTKNFHDEPDVPTKWEKDLALFIHHFPNLSTLSLELECKLSDSYPWEEENPYKWVDSAYRSRFSKLCTILHIPKLESLELDQIDCTGADLGFFILRHSKTLKRFDFKQVHLVDYQRPWSWLLRLIYENTQITKLTLHLCGLMGQRISFETDPEIIATSNKELLALIQSLEKDESKLPNDLTAFFDQPGVIPHLQEYADELERRLKADAFAN